MLGIWRVLVLSVLFLPVASVLKAQEPPKPPPEPVQIKINRVLTHRAGMGDRVRIKIDRLSEAIDKNSAFDPYKLILYLDGRPLKGLHPSALDPISNELEFQLKRTEGSKEEWTALLGSPKRSIRKTIVGVGPAERQHPPVDPKSRPSLDLVVFHWKWFIGCLITLALILALFVWFAKESNIIRDPGPPQPGPGQKKPYSLARLQMAVWFFLVVSSFLFIYLITGDHNTITEQALILIGIGTGTALGSAMVDANKRSFADRELEALLPEESVLTTEVNEIGSTVTSMAVALAVGAPAAGQNSLSELKKELAKKEAELDVKRRKIADIQSGKSKPVSESFLQDLLTDVNGISFHRFQMLVWTAVLGFLFCLGVYQTLTMPEFSPTLLALMGISAGTYLGFKIPERQN